MKPSPYEISVLVGMQNASASTSEFSPSERAEIKALARDAVREMLGDDIIERRSWPWWRRITSR